MSKVVVRVGDVVTVNRQFTGRLIKIRKTSTKNGKCLTFACVDGKMRNASENKIRVSKVGVAARVGLWLSGKSIPKVSLV